GTPRPRGSIARLADSLVLSAATRLLSAVDPKGSLTIVLPDGRRLVLDGAEPGFDALVDFPNLKTLPSAVRAGTLGFGEAYVEGHVTTPDLVAMFRFYLQNQSRLEAAGERFFKVRLPDRV